MASNEQNIAKLEKFQRFWHFFTKRGINNPY